MKNFVREGHIKIKNKIQGSEKKRIMRDRNFGAEEILGNQS